VSQARASIDFEGIAASALSAAPGILFRWLPAGRLRGHEFQVGSVRGEPGDSLSVNVNTGKWADFQGSARGGDLVSLYAAIHGLSQVEAAKQVSADLALPSPSATIVALPRKQEPAQAFQPIMPVPDDAPAAPAAHPKHGRPDHISVVRSQDGAVLHYIYRFEAAEDRRKQITPLCYGANGWTWKAPPAPRPLYGLPLQAGKPVLVVEGEKKRDAAARIFGETACVVSWPNGAEGVGKADWTVLAGRDVLIWPDNDSAGIAAGSSIVNVLRSSARSVRLIDPPDDAPPKWDLADAEAGGWDAAKAWSHIEGGGPPGPPDDYDGPDYGDYPDPAPSRTPSGPFRILGYDRDRYYFLSAGSGQVMQLTSHQLNTSASLTALAPLVYWEREFPGGRSTKFDVGSAADDLMRRCERVGVYDPDQRRGRGVWLENGQVVVHRGDKLLVDGEEREVIDWDGSRIFEKARRMDIPLAPPLDTKTAAKLIDLCKEPAWENKEYMGRLFAGWLVIAPVCGALHWRPHLWITSEAGGGKSWILDNLVKPVLGPLALRVQSKTSEAGIRSELQSDARPVIFDEAETQNKADQARMQQILDLARQSCDEDGAPIVKGTADGGSRHYRIRSCFVFSSINIGLTQAADESRTVVLRLVPQTDTKTRAESFDRLRKMHSDLMTTDFAARLLSRTLGLLPIIRANAETFAHAVMKGGGTRRTGDTIGAMLAGAWSLRSTRAASLDEASAFLAEQKWASKAVADAGVDPEWKRALAHLVQMPLRTVRSNGFTEDIPVGELVLAAAGLGEGSLSTADARLTLIRAGIKYDTETGTDVLVANTSRFAAKAFEETAWATGWASTIARADGATKPKKVIRFGSLGSRAVSIPISTFVGGKDAEGEA
jgi:putative DNA primase/helicase